MFVDDEGDGFGVGECLVVVLVFGLGWDLFLGVWFVWLVDVLLYGDGVEGGVDVVDVGVGVVFFGFEFG